MAPESFFSAKSSLFIHLFLILMLICFPPLDISLCPPSWLGWKELQQQESPFSHPLQSDLLLWRFLATGASLDFGESTLAMSTPEPEDKSFLLGFHLHFICDGDTAWLYPRAPCLPWVLAKRVPGGLSAFSCYWLNP